MNLCCHPFDPFSLFAIVVPVDTDGVRPNVVEVLLGVKLEECLEQIESNFELRAVADGHRLSLYFARTGIRDVATFPVMMASGVRKSLIREMWLIPRTRHKRDIQIIFMVCSINFKKSKFVGSSQVHHRKRTKNP